MAYRIASLDAAIGGPGTIVLAPEDEGYAAIIRRKGRPVGFVLRKAAASEQPRSVNLEQLVEEPTAERMVVAAMSEELPRRSDPALLERLSVTVAICTRDRPAWVGRCLDSIESLNRESNEAPGMFEVLVVDNAPSTDQTQAVVGARPGVRYVREPKLGLNFARNRALAEARGEFVAFLDDDVIVDAGWLSALSRAWLEHSEAGLFTGQVLPFELETPAQLLFEQRGGFRRGFERSIFRSGRPGDPFYPCSVGILGTGANMVVRRSVVLSLGGFDEALDTGAALPGGGDLDIFYRILRAGHLAVYEPACLVFHQHRRDMAGLRRQYRNSWGAAFMAFAVKSWRCDPPMRMRWLGLIAWWFGKQGTHLVKSIVGRHPRPPGMILNEAWGGVVGILGAYGRSRRRIDRILEASR